MFWTVRTFWTTRTFWTARSYFGQQELILGGGVIMLDTELASGPGTKTDLRLYSLRVMHLVESCVTHTKKGQGLGDAHGIGGCPARSDLGGNGESHCEQE